MPMKNLVCAAALCSATAAGFLLPAAPASAQALSSGDYAQCTVYDREGRNRGLDSVCLERKRTQIVRQQQRRARFAPPAYSGWGAASCPTWANGGRGFGYTVNSDGSFPGYAAAYDSVQNGRPCMPEPNIRLPGVP